MSWLGKLYETYQQAMLLDLPEGQRLMPISHTVQNAHINIHIDSAGNFIRAKVLEKTQIMLPATESSAGRSSGEAPHPLADKLQYVAADYGNFGGLKKNYFAGYQTLLKGWCESQFAHPKVEAVLRYVSKGTVIADLIKAHVCFVDDNNRLLTSWSSDSSENQSMPLLFKVLPKESGELDQGNALVCWSVIEPGDLEPDTWRDASVQNSWIAFDAQSAGKNELCYATGEMLPAASNHPAKLRHSGDKAKLVSANDASGFTFRGKFTDSEQVATVSFDVTQKAHNALRWLISRQLNKNGDQVLVTWAVSGQPVIQPLESIDWDDFSECSDDEIKPLTTTVDINEALGENFAKALKRYMQGYFDGRISKLKAEESIVILGLDSATPGRMAITYYRDFQALEYVNTVEKWHRHLAWPQRMTRETQLAGKKSKSEVYWPISAPSLWNILQAAYGDIVKSNETLKKSLNDRLLPCIVEAQPLPFDIVQLTVHKASNRAGYAPWEWERNLAIACALYKGFHHPERQPDQNKWRTYAMSLELQRTSRDYLFGRLLAVAEQIEEMAMLVSQESARTTNASRLMQRFADRPTATWKIIRESLQPYLQRLRVKRPPLETAYLRLLDDISCLFAAKDFVSPERLLGEYLLGFHCQRKWLQEHRLEKGQWVAKIATEQDAEIEEGTNV